MRSIVACIVLGLPLATIAEPPVVAPVLPDPPRWNGKSRKLVVAADHPWRTPFEASGLLRTPRYAETVAWLERLCAAAPELEMVSIGKSSEGRDIWMVIATRAGRFDPASVRGNVKPIVFAQAGIHAGEIDGKDAGMMLLRDLTLGGRAESLLDRASFLFVPILNPDGHERFGPYTRINQRGPVEAGWRTTALNLNLNRDYTKLDAPETRAVVRALVEWDPDLYFDLHVTDGGDQQYDITWGQNGEHAWSPASARWLVTVLEPVMRADLRRMGHVPGPFYWLADDDDPAAGWLDPTTGPRLSHGWGDARHIPTVLVENHSLKPYDRRVLGTVVLLESALVTVGKSGAEIAAAKQADRARRPSILPVSWRVPKDARPTTLEVLAIESRLVPSPVAGGTRTEWTGKPRTVRVDLHHETEPALTAERPRAYWIPPAWKEIALRLELHGILVEPQSAARDLDVEMIRITEATLDSVPYEGRVRVAPKIRRESQRRHFPAGSLRVSCDQPGGDLAMLLLEPESEDSFFQWGFFHSVLQRTEYVESYILDPTAERMLAQDDRLRAEFEAALRDSSFAARPAARRRWLYERTPFFDSEYQLYPIGRERE